MKAWQRTRGSTGLRCGCSAIRGGALILPSLPRADHCDEAMRTKRAVIRVAVALQLWNALLATRSKAQAMPSGAKRAWLELNAGIARQDQNCRGCTLPGTIGGFTAAGAIGLTVTPKVGLAVVARDFTEFSFEYSQTSTYYIALAEYNPVPTLPLTINGGVGAGQHRGDNAPYGNNGSGSVLAAGLALRIPGGRSRAGLTVTADWILSVSGRSTASSGQTTPAHPSLLALGLGLNVATPQRP